MTFFLIYIVFGVILGLLTRTEGDRIALFTGLDMMFLFVLLWPIPLLYMIHMVMKGGTLKYKGKVIWRARK
jgi:hypothetical protein